MEITKILDRYKFISKIIFSLIQIILLVVRKSNKLFPINQGNVVIVSLHKLGDSVFTIPAIREIQKYYKKKIIIICFPESIPIFNYGLSDISCCSIDHGDFFFNGRIATSKARKILKSCNPEIIFNLNGVMTSATLVFTSRAKLIIGMGREQFKTIYDIFVPEHRENHLMDMYLDTISVLIPIKDREIIKHFPKIGIRKGKILVHPFAGWKAKEWQLSRFIDLGKSLKYKYDIAIVASINSLSEDIKNEIREIGLTYIETNSMDDLIKNINECSVFIGNDSGPIHVADLLGKPTFCIYGPINPKSVRPLGDHHSDCRSVIKCSPMGDEELCFTFGGRYGCPAFECMNALSVTRVEKEILLFLDKIFENKRIEIDRKLSKI